MGLGRLELPTSPLSGVRSSHLSYRPNVQAGNILTHAAEIPALNNHDFIIGLTKSLAGRHSFSAYVMWA